MPNSTATFTATPSTASAAPPVTPIGKPPGRLRQSRFPSSAAREMETALRRGIRGEVRFDRGSRALYAVDSSNYRQVPIGVVIPRDADDVLETVAICRRFGAPLTGRGGGTSLAGQCCNAAVILDFSKYMNEVVEIDTTRRLARVQPGIILDHLNLAAKRHNLIFGPDPATHNHCTIGGMIGNNSGGVHSVMSQFYGPGARTSDNLAGLEVLTYDGLRMRVGDTNEYEMARILAAGGRRAEIYTRMHDLAERYAPLIRARYPAIPRRVSGYNLDDLLPEKGFHVARALSGSEGTCVTMLEATLHLMDDFPCRSLVVLGYPDIYSAGDHISEILEHRPIGLEGIDDILIDAMKIKGIHPADLQLLPSGKGWLIVEFGGASTAEADDRAHKLIDSLKRQPGGPSYELLDDPVREAKLWEIRDAGLGASARVPGQPDTWEGWEDAAVPPEKIGAYLREFRALLEQYGYQCTLYGHFGQGIVHTRIDFGLKTPEGIEAYERFGYDAARLVVRYGGSLSGEHGDGQSRGELLSIMYGPELVEAFEEFKGIWDPEWKMNPGKVVRPWLRDENLRYSPEPPNSYHPAEPHTHFSFSEDKGSFSYALERCVGVGLCRRTDEGTMCPSFMVTREEKHSTRGRARLLLEMLQGQVIGRNGWHDEHVREALDLCLACKGCKSDCPVNVDMASYKAEFLSHYYEGRFRPLAAYSMGLIALWARVANAAPRLVNFVLQTPPFSTVAKLLGGISQRRQMPRFADESFQDWFARRNRPHVGGPRVILWPDTFNNHLLPRTAKAAVNVLESTGFDVIVPRARVCCGRPLYDYGMLDAAKRVLLRTMDVLSGAIAAGTPIVGLEPSCIAVFRDELPALFPEDERAKRLSQQVFTLAEFLDRNAPQGSVPKLYRKALVHGHCHHKAVMKMTADENLLRKSGVEYELVDSGCCGLAGSFGFESAHYDISVACGERKLLPAVRGEALDTFIVTDGFSCRQQIDQLSNRKALHTAELLDLALHAGSRGPAGNHPEDEYLAERVEAGEPSSRQMVTAGVAASVAVAALGWLVMRRRR